MIEDEILERRYLAYMLALQDHHLAAWSEVELAMARLRQFPDLARSEHTVYRKLVLDLVGRQVRVGAGLDRNLAILREVADDITMDDEWLLYYAVLGATQELLGRRRRAEETYQRQLVFARRLDAAGYWTSAARNSLALQLERWRRDGSMQTSPLRSQRVRAALLADMEDLLAQLPQRDFAPRLQLRVLHSLGYLSDGQQALDYLDQCLRLADGSEQQELALACMMQKALALAADDPQQAREWRAKALAGLDQVQSLWAAGRVMRTRIHLAWQLDPPRQAVAETWAALASGQQFRLAQAAGAERAALFAAWVDDHRLAAGYVFTAAQQAQGELRSELLSAALKIQETMRARQLLDEVLQQRERRQREQLLLMDIPHIQQRAARIAAVAKAFRNSNGAAAEAALATLVTLQEALEVSSPVPPSLTETVPDVLEQATRIQSLRAALAPREALVLYQWAAQYDARGDAAGGAWALVVTASAQQPVRLVQLRPSAPPAAMLDLLAAPDASAEPLRQQVVERLAREWLQPVIDVLNGSTEHLVVVPDAALNRAPWPLLMAAAPLPRRLTLSLAPSASLWWGWRQQVQSAGRILVVADPELGERARQQLPAGARGALAGARAEAAAIRQWFPDSKHLLDEAASESAVLRHGPEYRLIHFAAHAVVDPAQPDRSALLMAADAGSDGVLSSAEIAARGWQGQAIVLAACDGAAGQILDGEGVFSLARAFLSAGARGVIANLWPLDDQHAQALFQRLYFYLHRGADLGVALDRAQQDLRAAGYPPRAWGGLVLIGDARMTTVTPPGLWQRPRVAFSLAGGSLLLLYAGVVIYRRRRR